MKNLKYTKTLVLILALSFSLSNLSCNKKEQVNDKSNSGASKAAGKTDVPADHIDFQEKNPNEPDWK